MRGREREAQGHSHISNRDTGRGTEPEPKNPTRPRVRDSVRLLPQQQTAVPAPSSRCQGGRWTHRSRAGGRARLEI